ncbi:MAG: pilus assembly protein, partial [Solirubrobacterales bacterium]|nr:pilus assembly protein [Solirubrobacterales bacterium]
MESARKTSPQAGRRSASPVDGQASVELVAVLPALLLALVVGLQLAAAGWSLWSATEAARAGARAELVGDDGSAAA